MIEATYKVSDTVEVPCEHGGVWKVEYVVNISDGEDTCDAECPPGMNDGEWIDREDEIQGACYADAYRRIDEEDNSK